MTDAKNSKMGLVAVYLRVLALLGPEKNLAITLALANVALAGLQFLEPILFGRIIEALVQVGENKTDPWANILQLIGIWAGAGAITIGATVLVSLHADRLSHRRRLAAKEIFLEKALEQSLSFFGRDHSGRLIKVMQLGADTLFGVWLSLLREHLSTIVCLVLLVPLSIWLNWRLGLVLAPMLVISMALSWYVAGRTEQGQRAVEADHSAMAAQTGDALTNIALVQSFVRAEEEIEAVRVTARRLLAAQYPVLNWWAATTVLTRMMATITLIALFLVGAWLHLNGMATVGDIVTFMGFATMLIGRVESALGFINRLFFEAPALEEYFTILEAEPAVRDKKGARDMQHVQGRIAFENVTFAYPAARTGVRGLDFSIEPGQSVALVGESGAGKSTALSLLSRFNEPQTGRILIDNTDIADATLASLRRNIAVVFQDSPLFNRTIRENLRVGKPSATDDEIIEATKRARAYEFIMATDKGFDTPVGERGMTLSGGERQRLNIARAFLKNAPILILDEATSALDAVTEQEVQGALSDLMHGRTTFIIAHRLSTIRHANLVLVLDGGIIVERGTFSHLKTNGRVFRRLVEAQMIKVEE